ncbi:IS110 family transposase [Paraburkholderia madseniana]|uniref:IS110 family transposase n=1 Tax=Paraburkholderia madseniana TaxID=2599607 RepID=UPI001F3EABF8|nr:IS110 family transposase [Paraburkholderia madseniana]
MKFSGIDLHSNNSVVVISDGEGLLVLQRRLPNDIRAILAALGKVCTTRFLHVARFAARVVVSAKMLGPRSPF